MRRRGRVNRVDRTPGLMLRVLGVRGYRNDRDLIFVRSIVPENSVGGRR
jgi:hypothetical protein